MTQELSVNDERTTSRREFVERVTAGALAIGVGSASLPAIAGAAATARASETAKPDNAWLDGIEGNHAQIFDMPRSGGGFGLFHVLNYFDTYKSSFGLTAPKVVAIVGLYGATAPGATTPLAFNDAMWAKYPFGSITQTISRESKTPVTRNPFIAAAAGKQSLGIEGAVVDMPAAASISSLQPMGARFIVCNNALSFWIAQLAARGAGTEASIRGELEHNLVPGVTIVPAMVIAINQAQAAGATYMYL